MTADNTTSGSSESKPVGDRYSGPAIALHWSIAALVLATIPLGLFGASNEGAAGQIATDIHKPVGILILALTIVRIGWRVTHRPPGLPVDYAPVLRWIARATHLLFYVLLIALPLSGWWMSSAVPVDRHPIGFGGVYVPFLPVERGWPSAGPARGIHGNLAWLMIGLAALHVLAALKHHFVDRDGVLGRILPSRT